jgi:hypothetical protein
VLENGKGELTQGLDVFMGVNLIMLAQMKMAPGLDEETLSRGHSLMERGRNRIKEILSGAAVQTTPNHDLDITPAMEYVQALAAAMVQVADTLEKVKLEEVNADTTAVHYFNLLINQALEMALKGSSQIMMDQMGTAEGVTKEIGQGRIMLSDARTVIIEVMGSRAMSEMHSRESGKMPAMGLTHKLASDTLEVLDMLDSLPESK